MTDTGVWLSKKHPCYSHVNYNAEWTGTQKDGGEMEDTTPEQCSKASNVQLIGICFKSNSLK